MNRLGVLLTRDARLLARDRLMLFLLGYGALLALILRFLGPLLPWEHVGVYLAPLPPLIGSLLVGTVLGFSLVEEREARTWLLFRVVPNGARVVSTYVVGLATIVSALAAVLCAALYGQLPTEPRLYAALLVGTALTSPLLMLFLGAMASNKLEAFAVSKLSGSLLSVNILAFLLPAGLVRLLWWNPWYWLYFGLVRAHTEPALRGELPVPVPDASAVVFAAPVIVASLVGCLVLARRYRWLVR